MMGRLRSLIADILPIECQDNCQYIRGMRWSERLKRLPAQCRECGVWNMIKIKVLGSVLLKPHERLLMKKMPLGPQFAQGLNGGIKSEVPNCVRVYSPAECGLFISKKLPEKMNC